MQDDGHRAQPQSKQGRAYAWVALNVDGELSAGHHLGLHYQVEQHILLAEIGISQEFH